MCVCVCLERESDRESFVFCTNKVISMSEYKVVWRLTFPWTSNFYNLTFGRKQDLLCFININNDKVINFFIGKLTFLLKDLPMV